MKKKVGSFFNKIRNLSNHSTQIKLQKYLDFRMIESKKLEITLSKLILDCLDYS